MTLLLRNAREDDLPRLHAMVRRGGRQLYAEPVLAALPDLWARLLLQRRLTLHVFEDTARPPAERLQGLASGGFVQREFARGLLQRFEPGVAQRVMAAELHGAPLLLDRAEAARANAGEGVCAMGLDFGFAHADWSLGTVLRWTPLLVQSLHQWLDGWRLQLGLRELVGRDLYLAYRASGLALYGKQVKHGERPLPGPQCRYLMGMTREMAQRRPTMLNSVMFFQAREPVLGLSPGEQDLLLLVLDNCDDDTCARLLGVSASTVKLRWRSIYLRVGNRRPDLLGPGGQAGAEGQRGPEKRRHLLAYLRQHMEELRPRGGPGASESGCDGPA